MTQSNRITLIENVSFVHDCYRIEVFPDDLQQDPAGGFDFNLSKPIQWSNQTTNLVSGLHEYDLLVLFHGFIQLFMRVYELLPGPSESNNNAMRQVNSIKP